MDDGKKIYRTIVPTGIGKLSLVVIVVSDSIDDATTNINKKLVRLGLVGSVVSSQLEIVDKIQGIGCLEPSIFDDLVTS